MAIEQTKNPARTKEAKLTRRMVLRPMAPSTYLLRNAGKSIPLTGVIMLAVMLIAGIVSMINSIPLSIRTIYSYSKQSLAVSPRGDPEMTPKIVTRIRKGSPVPIERIILCRATGSQVNSIVGKWPFVVLGFAPDDLKYFLERLGSKGVEGRLPKRGAAEAVVSEPVARNLRLKIGSNLQGPTTQESYSPYPVKVVGIAHTEEWLMAADIDYQRMNHFPPIDNVLVFAHTLGDQGKLDRWAIKAFKGERAQVFAYHILEKQTNEMFKTLYKILNVVIGMLVLVITVMMAMLINIYQSQRLVEFGLLQAIGYTKKQLLSRVMRETAAVILLGWIFGVLLSWAFLVIVDRVLMQPQAYSLSTLDTSAFLYSLPVPMAILIAATLTVYSRFRKFDPVGVVERRLV